MANMTRQHYEHLAATLGEAVADEAGGGRESKAASFAAYRVALAVAASLQGTNDAYDEERFMDAVDKHAFTAAQVVARDGEGVGYSYEARMGIEEATAQRRRA